jgi:hypothetical protein
MALVEGPQVAAVADLDPADHAGFINPPSAQYLSQQISSVFDGCFGFLGMLIGAGAGAGGIIGGVGGSVLGAGLASGEVKAGSQASIAVQQKPAGLVDPPTESPEGELARSRQRVAELEAQRRQTKPTADRDLF